MGVAELLASMRQEIAGTVRFVFQPGKAKGLNAVYHFIFSGTESRMATVSTKAC